MTLTPLSHRIILEISGEDRLSFLQGLVTNDLYKLQPDQLSYAALLTPQGKIIADFFVSMQGESLWLECWQPKAALLLQKLQMFRLRAKVQVTLRDEVKVYHSTEERAGGLADPRHAGMGYRLYSAQPLSAEGIPADYTALRLQLGIPESEDVVEDRSFPMELGLPSLHAISYSKGCYVGQEVVARSKTRGTLHKAIHQVISATGEALPPMDTPVMLGDAEIGVLRTTQGVNGLAILRLEEAKQGTLTAAGIPLTATLPDWFSLPTPVTISI
jgi:folate-binding protein YgfZ